MKIIRNRLLPIGRRFAAINVMGVLFVKPGVTVGPTMLCHEEIHTRQMRELLYVGFYVAYVAEWMVNMVRMRMDWMRAYHSISFEREAYRYEKNHTYLLDRPHFAMWRKK